VQLASHIGSNKASQSSLSDKEPPMAALHTALKGMVSQDSEAAASADAEQKNTATAEDKLPHSTDALLTIAAQAGWMLSAGQDIQVTAGETITWGAGQDISWAIGGSQRIHSGQAIGVLAGAVAPGDKAAGKGITLIAGQGDIEVQAQADQLQVAAKRIVLSTAGGASLTIEGGNIIVECSGTITVKAGTKSFVGPQRLNQDMPSFPKSTLTIPMRFNFDHAPAGLKTAWAGMPFKLYADGAMIKQDVLDESGVLQFMHSPLVKAYKLELANGVRYDLPIVDSYRNAEEGGPANQGYLKHEPGAPAADTGNTKVPGALRAAYRKVFKS
jgi:type VI secretion system secreted protein VgrG